MDHLPAGTVTSTFVVEVALYLRTSGVSFLIPLVVVSPGPREEGGFPGSFSRSSWDLLVPVRSQKGDRVRPSTGRTTVPKTPRPRSGGDVGKTRSLPLQGTVRAGVEGWGMDRHLTSTSQSSSAPGSCPSVRTSTPSTSFWVRPRPRSPLRVRDSRSGSPTSKKGRRGRYDGSRSKGSCRRLVGLGNRVFPTQSLGWTKGRRRTFPPRSL